MSDRTTTYFGDQQTNGNTLIKQNFTVLGESYFNSNIVGAQAIGSSTARWPNIWANTLNVSVMNTLTLASGMAVGTLAPSFGSAAGVSGNIYASTGLGATNVLVTTANFTGTTMNVTSLSAQVRIGSVAAGATIGSPGNVWTSTGLGATNVLVTTANLTGTTMNVTSLSAQVSIGSVAAGATIGSPGNVYASNAVSATNVIVTSSNISFVNVNSLTSLSNVGIRTSPVVGGPKIQTPGNISVANTLTTLNIYGTGSLNTTTLNVLSFSPIVAVNAPSDGQTNLYVNGSISVSGSFGTALGNTMASLNIATINLGSVVTNSQVPIGSFPLSISPYLVGSAALTSTAPTGNTAVSFPGSAGSYVNFGSSNPGQFDYRTSNIFIEAWIYANSLPSIKAFITAYGNYGGVPTALRFVIATTGGVQITLSDAAGTAIVGAAQGFGTFVSAGSWFHIYGFIDLVNGNSYVGTGGVQGGSTTGQQIYSPFYYSSSDSLYIGGNTTNYNLNGYIRDLRIIKGCNFNGSTFTPDAFPFSSSGLPSYVTGGTTVFTLSNYYQLTAIGSLAIASNLWAANTIRTTNLTATLTNTQTANVTSVIVPANFVGIGTAVPTFTSSTLGPYLTGSASLVYGSAPDGATAVNFPRVSGTCANFGTNSANFNINTSNLICEAWVYIPSITSSISMIATSNVNAFQTDYNNWMFWVSSSTGAPRFHFSLANNTGGLAINTAIGGPPNIQSAQWNHLVWIIDSTNSRVNAALNGSWTGGGSYTGPLYYDASSPFGIGGSLKNATIYILDGYIRDLRIVKGGIITTSSSFAPTPVPFGTSLPSYVTGGTTVFSLASQYIGSTPSLTIAPSLNLGAYLVNPYLVGSASVTTTAPTANTAVRFPNGYGSRVNFGTGSPANFDLNSSNIFCEAWIYLTGQTYTSMVSVAATMLGPSASPFSYFFGINASGVGTQIKNQAGSYIINLGGGSTPGTGSWFYAAWMVNSVQSYVNWAINGTLQYPPTQIGFTGPIAYDSSAIFQIGGSNDGGPNMDGYIRDVRIIKGSILPSSSFTPDSAPFSPSSLPSYVTGGSVVFTFNNPFLSTPWNITYRTSVTNVISTPSFYAPNANITTANVTQTVSQIGIATAPTGNTLTIAGNVYATNAVSVTNVSVSQLIGTTLNAASIQNVSSLSLNTATVLNTLSIVGRTDQILVGTGSALTPYLSGSAVYTINAPSGNAAVSFPGVIGSCINLGSTTPAHYDFSTSNVFCELWVYFNSLSSTGDMIYCGSSGSSYDFNFFVGAGSPSIQIYYYDSGGTFRSHQYYPAALNTNQWYHIAFGITTSGTARMFLNGTGGINVQGTGTIRYNASSSFSVGGVLGTGWGDVSKYVQDVRIISGSTIPSGNFTPSPAPFGLGLPSYVTGGTTVFSLASQYNFLPGLLAVSGNVFLANGYTNTTLSLPQINYTEDTTRRSIHLVPSASNATTIQSWISAQCNSTPSYWSTTSQPIFSNVVDAGTPANAFQGSVLLPDGRVVFVPYNSSNVGVYNPATRQYANVSAPDILPASFSGGVLLPNGNVVFTPQVSNIGQFNPLTLQYSNGASLPGGEYSATLTSNGVSFVPQGVPSNIIQYNYLTGATTNVLALSNAGWEGSTTNVWTARTLSVSDTWIALCWSPQLRLFCTLGYGVGFGSKNASTSPDGITWTTRSLSNTAQWVSVTWSPQLNLFCAVENNPGKNISRSSDGITWSNIAVNASLQSICWAPELGVFCAVGSTQTVARSSDGTTWTVSSALPSSTGWTCVCWSPQLRIFCAVATNGTQAALSSDGISWILSSGGFSSVNWISICWSPQLGLFCGVARATASAITSLDGNTWTARTLSTIDNWRSVCWSSQLGLFCTVADTTSNCAISPDGVNWTPTGSMPSSANWYSICWAPELGVFCSTADTTTAATRNYQLSFNQFIGALPAMSASSVAWSPQKGVFVVGGFGATNSLQYSYNGINWSTAASTPSSVSWNSICWSPQLGLFVAVSQSTAQMALYSSDGVNWTAAATIVSGPLWQSTAWSPQLGLFVTVGYNASPYAAYSSDGKNWASAVTPPSGTAWYSIAWSSQLGLFAIGGGATPYFAYSTDGKNWTNAVTAVAGAWLGMAWSPQLGLFVAVGSASPYIAYSSDGKNWTQAVTVVGTYWRSVVWSNQLGLFITVGPNTPYAACSADGKNWRAITPIPALAWYGITTAPELGILCTVGGNSNVAISSPATPVFKGALTLPTGNVVTVTPGTTNFTQFSPTALTTSNLAIDPCSVQSLILSSNGLVVGSAAAKNYVVIDPVVKTSYLYTAPTYGPVPGTLTPSGNVIFASTSNILTFNPSSYIISNSTPTGTAFNGATLHPSGQVILCPGTGSNVGVISFNQPAPREFCLSPYFNKL